MTKPHLESTDLLDFENTAIQRLIEDRAWRNLDTHARIGAVYNFVRDEVAFGYNESDDLAASRVLADGYGQCNTKTTLLMALLRGVGIPCRVHGATIDKQLQRGVINGLFYWMAPSTIVHSWAEIYWNDKWLALEGVILDSVYLSGVRDMAPSATQSFLGYGVGTENLASPPIEWRGDSTFIQATGLHDDFGAYDNPDRFYQEHGANLSGWKHWLFKHVVRKIMNRNVARIRGRSSGACAVAGAC